MSLRVDRPLLEEVILIVQQLPHSSIYFFPFPFASTNCMFRLTNGLESSESILAGLALLSDSSDGPCHHAWKPPCQ